MNLELNNKTIIITGASDGLGAAATIKLANEGANVVLAARGQEKLLAVATRIQEAGGKALAVATDVTKENELQNLVEQTVKHFGNIDGLVNNAGRAAAKPFENLNDTDWNEDLNLKFHAAHKLSKLCLPHLKTKGGSIINILAIGGKTPGASSMPSSVSRAAGMALGKAMSKDLGKHNIRVNSVLIGFVESDQWLRRAAQTGTPLEDIYANLVTTHNIPLGRVGKSEEFADLIAFLLSARAAYISGTAINFDGGVANTV